MRVVRTTRPWRTRRQSSRLADLQDARDTRHGCSSEWECVRDSGPLASVPSVGKGAPATCVQLYCRQGFGFCSGRRCACGSSAELTRLHATLDPEHVDNLVHAVAQKGGSQMICDSVTTCETPSRALTLRGVWTAQKRHASSLVGGACQRRQSRQRRDFPPGIKAGWSRRQPMAYNWLARGVCRLWRHRWRSEVSVELKRVGRLDVVSHNTLLKAHLNTSCLDELRS